MPIVLKSGSLNLLEPSGAVQGCNGIALPFLDKACQPLRPIAWSLVKLPVDGTVLEVGSTYTRKLRASKKFIRTGISTLEQIRLSNPPKSELRVAVNI